MQQSLTYTLLQPKFHPFSLKWQETDKLVCSTDPTRVTEEIGFYTVQPFWKIQEQIQQMFLLTWPAITHIQKELSSLIEQFFQVERELQAVVSSDEFSSSKESGERVVIEEWSGMEEELQIQMWHRRLQSPVTLQMTGYLNQTREAR